MPDQGPVGIFDSGVGGISVMKLMREMLPKENMIYFADSKYCPYGTRPPESIRKRSIILSKFLVSRGSKIIVVACNTASSAVLNELRKIYSIPVVGMEPGLKPAVTVTQNKKIGILATGATINGERFHSLVNRFGKEVTLITQPCPGLVELVENGDTGRIKAQKMVEDYLHPLINEGVDTVVLGCTHYPFLKDTIQEITGKDINIIDTGEAVARRVFNVLKENNLFTLNTGPGYNSFFTSGDPEKVTGVVKNLMSDENIQVLPVNI